MIVVAALALTIFHPGFCFPQLAGQQAQKALPELESLDENDAVFAERKIQERQESGQVSTSGQ